MFDATWEHLKRGHRAETPTKKWRLDRRRRRVCREQRKARETTLTIASYPPESIRRGRAAIPHRPPASGPSSIVLRGPPNVGGRTSPAGRDGREKKPRDKNQMKENIRTARTERQPRHASDSDTNVEINVRRRKECNRG